MIKVKICGITRIQDALVAADAGADFVGLIFAKSPRKLAPETAREIVEALPRGVKPVGVFMNQSLGEVKRTLKATGIRHAQLHGKETPRFCSQLDVPVIKSFDRFDTRTMIRLKKYETFAYLLDVPKGNGSATYLKADGVDPEWAILAKRSGHVLLAGKLTPKNVASRINRIRPWGVDVASGVEKSPGIKDRSKVRDFIQAARQAGKSKTIMNRKAKS